MVCCDCSINRTICDFTNWADGVYMLRMSNEWGGGDLKEFLSTGNLHQPIIN